MWRLKQFEKQGGIQFLKNLYSTKTLFYALLIFPFLMGSKKTLEIFRLAVANKTYRYIYKKFKNKSITYEDTDISEEQIQQNKNSIWFMWLQGIENAPEIVKYNLLVLQKKFGNERVKVVTWNNLFEYINLPSFIKIKLNKKLISLTHLSDIVRIQLLVTYGGMWVDSTVLFSGNLPDSIYNQSFFVPQTLKPGRDGVTIPVSNWLIIAKRNNNMAVRLRNLLFNYWENYNNPIDYFIFHHLMMLVFDEFPDEFTKIIAYDNSQPHALLIAMKSKEMNQEDIQEYLQLSPIHKLTNKLSSKLEKENQKQLISVIKSKLFDGE
ncbi:capsular polysaccharide synthesis protein [Weissella paramesenteroides]